MTAIKHTFFPAVFFAILLTGSFFSLNAFSQQAGASDLAEAKRLWDLSTANPTPEGIDPIQSLKRAKEIYLEAAEKGNADAQFVVADYSKERLKWYLLAAGQGHPQAQYVLFETYMYGRDGVSINKTLAEEMCTKAAKQGYLNAMLRYSMHFSKNNVEKVFYAQACSIYEMQFMERHRPESYESVMKITDTDVFFRNRTYRQLYEENKGKFVNDFQNSCNNVERYGKYIPRRYFELRSGASGVEGALDDYFLTPEERKEVINRLLSWSPVLEWKPDNESVSPDKPQKKAYAIKAAATPGEVKPDGKSTAEITATLYEYTRGTDRPSKPLVGKTVNFAVNEQHGIIPGRVSATSAVTDANGQARIVYTAPVTTLVSQAKLLVNTATITAKSVEYDTEDMAYISFITDKGKVEVEPAEGISSDHGLVPPDRRYPALIRAYFDDEDLNPKVNTDVIFSITGSQTVGMLRTREGTEGKQLTVKTDAGGWASVNYFYAADTPREKPVTETIEVRTSNMIIPLKAYVSTGLNIVLENAVSGYESSKEVNAGDEVPLKITVRDEWNKDLDLAQIMNYWGTGNEAGNNRLYVKLEIEKQGFVPRYMLDWMGSENFPEPMYEELLYPKTFKDKAKNLLYISEYSLKKEGLPRVKPMFSGTNNYEIRVSLVDDQGKKIFESPHPRKTAFVSIPTGLPAETYAIWFASNPLGPHTELSRFARMLFSLIDCGSDGQFGSILSLVDAAFAINSGDAEALVNVMLSEIKGKLIDDAAEKSERMGHHFKTYKKISFAEQYLSFAWTTYADNGLVAQMENKILSEIARAGFGSQTKMVVLKGNGEQKLLLDDQPEQGTNPSKAFKDNFKIKISGIDKKTTEFIEKIGKKMKPNGVEIPAGEGKFVSDEKMKTSSLKNGKVSVFIIPSDMKVVNENADEMKIY